MPARPAASCWRPRRPRPSAPPTSFSASTGSISPAPSRRPAAVTAKVVQVSVDHRLHNGWSMDYQGLPPVDVLIACEPDAAVPALLEALGPRRAARGRDAAPRNFPSSPATSSPSIISPTRCAARSANGPPRLTHVSLSWNGASWAVAPSARLSRLRRRRRRRRRARHFGRRRAGAQRLGPAAGRGLRRRRFHDGLHRAVDGGALPHSAADRGGQQPLLLQRRTAPGARRPHAQPPGREPLDRPAHFRARHRHCRPSPARKARKASAR